MKKPETWQVDVHADGEVILSIGSGWLSGRDDIADFADTVRDCADHLMSFIGPDPNVTGYIEALRAENTRLLQLYLSTQRDADSLLEKLHAAERENERLKGEVKVLDGQIQRWRLSSNRNLSKLIIAKGEAARMSSEYTTLRARLLLLSSQLPSQYHGEIVDLLGEG